MQDFAKYRYNNDVETSEVCRSEWALDLPSVMATAVNKAKDGIILNWRNNLDASEGVQGEHVDIELWSIGSDKEMKLIHQNAKM